MKGASLYQNSSNQECCKYGARDVLLSEKQSIEPVTSLFVRASVVRGKQTKAEEDGIGSVCAAGD